MPTRPAALHRGAAHPSGRAALDFLVIGAQKAGTTAVHEYLQSHGGIALPESKEAPYFNRPAGACADFDEYLALHFGGVSPTALRGTVTPQYLCGPDVPARLKACCPDVRIICILREPVDRARSHYRMLLQRGDVELPMESGLAAQLEADALLGARALSAVVANEPRCCVAWSEYGRLLRGWYEHFEASQFLVLFYDDLVQDPAMVLDAMLEFLGLERGFRPANLGRPVASPLPGRLDWAGRLVSRGPGAAVWRALPRRVRQFMRRAARPSPWQWDADDHRIRLSAALQARLRAHFRTDVALLESLLGRPVTWPGYT